MQRYLAALLFSLAAFCSQADTLFDFEMKNLKTGKTEKLPLTSSAPTLLVFFQPDCKWCEKQIALVTQLQQDCQQPVQALAIGTLGGYRELKKEVRKQQISLPSYLASSRFISALGGINTSPVSVLFNTDGTVEWAARGYQKEAHLSVLNARLNCKQT